MWSVERAPDGGLNIIVEDETITQVAQRLMCWSKHDARITYVFGAPFQYFHIPPALFTEGNYGDLKLKVDGEIIEPITCNRAVFNQPGLEDVSGIDPNACVDDVQSPTVTVDTAEVTNTTAVVRWTLPWDGTNAPESPVHQALFDVVYRKASDDPACTNRWKHLRLRGWERSVKIGGLTPGTTYEVAVGTVDKRVWVGIESSLSTVVSFTTTGEAPVENGADLCEDDGDGPGPSPVTVTVTQGADANSAQATVANIPAGATYTYQFIAPAGGTNVPAAPADIPAGGAVPSTTLTAGTGWTLRVCDKAAPTNCVTSAPFDVPFTAPGPVTVAVAQGADVNSAQGTVTGMVEGTTYAYQFIAPAGGTNVPAAPAPLPAGGAVPSTTLTAGTGWILRVTDDATPATEADSAAFNIPFTAPEPVTVTVAQGADVNSAQGTVTGMDEALTYTYQFIAPAGGTNVPAAPAAVPAGGAVPSTTLTAGTGWILRVTDNDTPPTEADSAAFDVPFAAGIRRAARK